ncbi:exodeoxyribonuclease III [Pseudonocardia sp. KRD-184]|uniref:Exodeoxyribonuclease III n=1 Tax=Pseudonocardia oceani TaxID=2792013 RepID=A0ABS6U6N5_9PSEU|nr:exodeoxyribonuclease III [Pseudonocardia oceani]MBW0095189.1 exodeoxyribonuclease III [Pseudonocardia oceani]MBW0108021.1 exodeoxyribonuclease III [Pseudonocardia oceani]MBW0120739.1 exodeoxyribonuclease III [Pseudonocardia oceani]MBW0127881.1 exodeoxyribonuclease III [Pseudonocardia oceani]
MGQSHDVLVVSSVNVNGIRAAAGKGLAAWLATTPADVVCLQETRAQPEEVPAGLFDGWHARHAPSEVKGRSGVAILTRAEPGAARTGIDDDEFAGSGRYLEVDLPGVTVASLYLPNGTVGTPKQDEKDRFLARFAPYLALRRAKAAAEDREVLVCGDWNIAPEQADIRNWRGNVKNCGFLPHEREWLAALFGEGWVDVVRAQHPGVDGPYSWWSYRGRAFDNDTGWRIDHHVATPGLADRARSAVVERAPSHAERWSDHAPVTVVYGP